MFRISKRSNLTKRKYSKPRKHRLEAELSYSKLEKSILFNEWKKVIKIYYVLFGLIIEIIDFLAYIHSIIALLLLFFFNAFDWHLFTYRDCY
jgi:hypothetical protein